MNWSSGEAKSSPRLVLDCWVALAQLLALQRPKCWVLTGTHGVGQGK